jgi:hypothetical protein
MFDINEKNHIHFWNEISKRFAADIPEMIEAEKKSRVQRIEEAFRAGMEVDTTGVDQQLFDKMWLDNDIDAVNAELVMDFTRDLETTKARKTDSTISPAYDLYHLMRNSRLISFYFCFGSKSTRFPGRLHPETEKLLLELLWWRTMDKNDISITRNSTWWISGSENHDLNSKVTNMLSSAIFADEADYCEKIYPDYGYGCSPGYMSAGYNPEAGDAPEMKGKERAVWSDGNEYRAVEHYEALLEYLKEYFAERVKKGFFLENGSPGYMRFTIAYILLLYNFCPDAALRQQVKMFLDLFWVDWALQSLGGLRGGPKTRHHNKVGSYDAMSDWARFYLGGSGLTTVNYMQQLIGDYSFNPLLWEMVIDRKGLGSFAYISRGIGEEEETCPRPFGVERTMTGNRESRMVKYSYVTPDYVLGTQMDHPLAVHNHLSAHGRWQGLITSDLNSRILTISLEQFRGKTDPGNDYSIELMYHSAQSKGVLITQQKRRWTQLNPDWFPTYDQLYDIDFGLYIGSGWQTRIEQDGWLFLEQDDTYAAIRILRVKTDPDPLAFAKGTDRYENYVEIDYDSYSWNEPKTILKLANKFSPIIIEAGRRDDYSTLADFKKQILANKLEIHKTVATHETKIIVVYKGADAEEIVFNAANQADVPTVGGKYINYRYPKTFDAPYLQADYESGVVEMKKGDHRQVLNFNTISCDADSLNH